MRRMIAGLFLSIALLTGCALLPQQVPAHADGVIDIVTVK